VPHVTLLQAFVPVQVMMQSAVPHVMSWQALSPTQLIVHFAASLQVMLLQSSEFRGRVRQWFGRRQAGEGSA